MTFTRAELEHFAAKERDRFEDLLKDFVEVPSVSADPAHKPDVERVRRAGRRDAPARSAAAPSSSACRAAAPSCSARFDSGPAHPTVTVYNHLDVQPASKETEPWRTRAVRLHEGGRHLSRPRHHRRQGPGAHGAARRRARRSRRACR